ncbi:TPA: hypothetical protein ACFNMG_001311 [Neisseria lactamica]
MPSETLLSVSDGILTNTVRSAKQPSFYVFPMLMFQHAGRYKKHRPKGRDFNRKGNTIKLAICRKLKKFHPYRGDIMHPPPPRKMNISSKTLSLTPSVSDSIKSFPNSTAIGRKI